MYFLYFFVMLSFLSGLAFTRQNSYAEGKDDASAGKQPYTLQEIYARLYFLETHKALRSGQAAHTLAKPNNIDLLRELSRSAGVSMAPLSPGGTPQDKSAIGEEFIRRWTSWIAEIRPLPRYVELAALLPSSPPPHFSDAARALLYGSVKTWQGMPVKLAEVSVWSDSYVGVGDISPEIANKHRSVVEMANFLLLPRTDDEPSTVTQLREKVAYLAGMLPPPTGLSDFTPIVVAKTCCPKESTSYGAFSGERSDLPWGADDGNHRLIAYAQKGHSEVYALAGTCEQR